MVNKPFRGNKKLPFWVEHNSAPKSEARKVRFGYEPWACVFTNYKRRMLSKQLSDFEARPEVPLSKGLEVCCLATDERGGGRKIAL